MQWSIEKRVVNKVVPIKVKEEMDSFGIWECVYLTIWGSDNIVQLWKVPVSYSYDKLKADDVTKLGSRALGGFSEELVASL